MKRKKLIPVDTYSRIVGYFQPTRCWNPGKQEEFKEREPIKLTEEEGRMLKCMDEGKKGYDYDYDYTKIKKNYFLTFIL